MSVLVTGGGGFVGRPLLELLGASGEELHAIHTRSQPPEIAGVSWHRCDLLDAAATGRLIDDLAPARLVHLAWYVEHGKYWQAPENVSWVEATLRLLRLFVAAGGRRAVLAGTCAEYAWSRKRYAETAPLVPATMYGVAKNATREVAERLAADAGAELAWARVFMPYGPAEPPGRLLASVIGALMAGREAPVTVGTQIRDFIYVDDLARAFAAILDSSLQGPVNVGTGEGTQIRELVACAARALDRADLVRWGAVPQREDDPVELVADVTRLQDEVGFAPAVDMREGVERTVAWWRRGAL
jgi:nucleoside-diphosphate-sugar epimerase